MALSVEQLQNPPTRQETASWLKQTLTDLGLATTGWQPNRAQLQMLNAFASLASGASELAANFVNQGFNSYASGAGLKLYSENRYDNTPEAARSAQGPMTFTNSSTTPYTQTAGAIVLQDSIGVQFINAEDATIPAGGIPTDVEMVAVLAGTSGNIGNDSILTLVTSLSGVVVTNPGPGSGVAWYSTRVGADPETDPELQQRNSTKWGAISTDKSSTAVENLALGIDGVAKVAVVGNNPRGANTVDVYVSAADQVLSDAEMLNAQEVFADRTFGTEAVWPPTNTPFNSVYELIKPGTEELVVEGVVYFDPAYDQTEVEANISARMGAFVQLTPIGGTTYANGASNIVTLGSIYEVLENTVGVRSVTLTAPLGDFPLGPTELLTSPADWITGRLDMVPSDT